VTRSALAGLIRRAVPGLRVTGDGPSIITLISALPRARVEQGPCFEARELIAAGAGIHIDDAAAVSCDPDRKPASIERDPATGEARAVSAIGAGAYLGRLRLAESPEVRAGDRLTLISSAGPVRIQRQVTALQPARRKDRRLFVAASDGAVFAAPLKLEGSHAQ
jgi:hypothetical protein